MSYGAMLDSIFWANGSAQDNKHSPHFTEQVDQAEQPFVYPPKELELFLDQIKSTFM